MKELKETKEMLDGIMEITLLVIKSAKDGLDLGDAVNLIKVYMTDDNFREKLAAAIQNADQIPDEFKDISSEELVDLGKVFLTEYLPKILKALKDEKP